MPAPGVLENDEPNGAELVTLAVDTRLGGSVTLTPDGSFVYTPPADPGHLPRVDDFTYTLRGPDGEASATVALTLYGSPLAADDHYGTLEDTALVVAAPGVLENDDPQGASIEAFDATSTAGGSVLLAPSGALTYTPPAGFVGADSFFYTLTDVAGSATATVNVQVGRAPLAADDQYLGSKGELLTPDRAVLDNDALGAPDALIVSFGGGSLGGSVTDHPVGTTAEVAGSSLTLAADGLFIFEPEPGLVGPFEFTYHIENASGSSEATVVIDVHEAPFAVDDEFDMLAGETLDVPADDAASLLYDDVGTPAPVITSYGGGTLGGSVADHAAGASVVTGGGTLTVNADGSFNFATTADASGEVRFDYHIESAAGNDEGSVTITVAHPPEIQSPNVLTLRAGASTNLPFELTVTGTPEPTLSIDGALPSGVLFEDGSLTGAPAAEAGGVYALTVTAENGVEPDAIQTLTVTVQTEAVLLGSADATFTVGTEGTYTPTTIGGVPAPTLTLDGTLPLGLTFDPVTGSISGTPEDATGGTYAVDIIASNGIDADAALEVLLEVLEAPEITSDDAVTFTVGEPASFEVTTTGNPDRSLSLSGTLPSGLSFDGSTGLLEGTPAAGSGGEYELALEASNGVLPDALQALTVTVNEAPSLSGAATATFTIGNPGTYTATRGGFPSPTLSLTGALPAGVSFNAETGTIGGTPEPGTSGSYALTLSAENGIGTAATLSVTLGVQEVSNITSANATTFVVGTAGTFTVTAAGTPAPTLSVSGTLPSGVSFTPATGVLSGTPAAGTGGTYDLTIGADNGVGTAGSQSFTLTVNEAPSLLGAATTTFVVGQNDSYSVTRGGFPLPTLSLSGSLPSGLSFDATSGGISGTPAPGTGGSYPVSIGADNGIGSAASLPVTLTVNEGPAITSANATTFTVGSAGTFTVTRTGTPTATLSVTGSLPSGITFTPGTGVLSGTAAAGTGGVYTLTFGADNGVGSAASQSFTLTVNEAPSLSGAASATFVVGTLDTYTATRGGFPEPTLSLSGSLPSGLSFGAATGTISGTAQAGTGGSYSVTISADNGIGSLASLPVAITVNEASAITSANATTFTVGSAGSFNVTSTGTPAATLSVSGALPSGVTFAAATGLLSGTPAAGTGGTYPLTFGADNGVGTAASQSFTLTVNEAPSISGAATTTFVVGSAGNYTVTRGGFPAPTFSVIGSLPSGLSVNSSTGAISGTPASGTAGSYPVTLSAENGIGAAATLAITITVNEAAAITSSNAATFTAGSAGTFTVTATGTPAPTFGVTGTLPTGVTLSSSTGVLSGTPGAGTGGAYPLTLSADNGVGTAASQSFTLTVNQAPAISGAPPSPADSGAAYSHAFTLSGFPAPTTAVASGTLPTGLSLSSAGVLSGTPTTPGTFSDIVVRATNTVSFADITFTIVVSDPTPPPSASAESFAVTGNIPIDVPVGSSVLNNDTLNTATLTGFGPSLASAATTAPGGTLTTNAGGSVTLASDGSFSYDPPAGTTGSDSFAYTITNVAGSATAQVSFTISNRVWFVDASAPLGGTGKLTSQFSDLPSVTSTASGDVIYALRSASPYSAKTLSSGQRLLGQGVTVSSTDLGFSLAPFSRSAFGTAGTNSSLRRLVLATNSYVRGFDVSALSGVESLSGSSISGVDVSGMAVTASNAVAVNLQSLSGAVSLTSVTATGGSFPIFLLGTTGSFTVTGDGTGAQNGSGGTIQGATSSGIALQTAQNVTLRSMNLQNITNQAVFGTNVVNLTLQGMQFSTIGTALDFDENLAGNANLTGTVSITDSSFSNATAKFFALLNFSGTLTSFTFDDNTLSTNPSGAFEMLIFDAARAETVSVKNNTFTNAANSVSNAAIQIYLGRTTSATSTPFASVRVEDNTITGSNGSGIRLRVQDSNGTLHARVLNNSVTGMTSAGFTQGIRVEAGTSTGDSTVCAQISGNTSVFSMGGLDPSSTPNAGIGLRRQTGSGGTNDVFGIVGLPAGTATCPVTGTATCAATPAVESFVGGLNPGSPGGAANGSLGGYLISSTTGFSSCTLP